MPPLAGRYGDNASNYLSDQIIGPADMAVADLELLCALADAANANTTKNAGMPSDLPVIFPACAGFRFWIVCYSQRCSTSLNHFRARLSAKLGHEQTLVMHHLKVFGQQPIWKLLNETIARLESKTDGYFPA